MNAERAVELLSNMLDNCTPNGNDTYNDPLRKEKQIALSMAIAELSIPSGTYARWERKNILSTYPKCSACGDKNRAGFTKFCPSCGARMDAEEKPDAD